MDEMEIIYFENLPSTKTPISADNLNKIQINAKKAIKNKKAALELLTVSIVPPTECKVGDKYYNTIDKKIYTATEENIWETDGTEPLQEYLYIDLGNKNLYYYDGTNFNSYGGGSGGGDTLPIGTIVPYGSDVIPDGWLRCDGSIVEQSDYPELFSVIGTTYGYYSRTDFKLPDLQGRVAVGKNSVIDTENPDTDFDELGKTGGRKDNNLQVVTEGYGLQTDSLSYSNRIVVGKSGITQEQSDKDNLQPYLVTNYIIKAKKTVSIKGEIIQETGTASMDNVYSAIAVDNKINTLKEIVLYEDDNGTQETITLSETSENFSYIEVFARYGTAYFTSVKIPNPNKKYFNITSSMMNQLASTGYIAATNYSISDKTLAPQYYGEWKLSDNTFSAENRMIILKVVGYK